MGLSQKEIITKYMSFLKEGQRESFLLQTQKAQGLTIDLLESLIKIEPDSSTIEYISSILKGKITHNGFLENSNNGNCFIKDNLPCKIEDFNSLAASVGAVRKADFSIPERDYLATYYFDAEGKEVYQAIDDFKGTSGYCGTVMNQRVWGKEEYSSLSNHCNIVHDGRVSISAVSYDNNPTLPPKEYELELNLNTGKVIFSDPSIVSIRDSEEVIFYVNNPREKHKNFSFPIDVISNKNTINESSLRVVTNALSFSKDVKIPSMAEAYNLDNSANSPSPMNP